MSMKTLLGSALVLSQLLPDAVFAQVAPEFTRFSITASPTFLQPGSDFGQNINAAFGGGGGFLYRLDRSGVLSFRFDLSGERYGIERRQVPFSETVGQRVLVKLSTANWIASFNVGPEVSRPSGFFRPYGNAGFSRLLLRTTSSLNSENASENPIATTTNYSDGTNALFFGGGLRFPLAAQRSHGIVELDLGLRYVQGGYASYLREGSIQDNPGGPIFIAPINSKTSHVIYIAGVHIRIPHDPARACPRFVC